MVTEVRNITLENTSELSKFLNSAGDSLNTFRYFSSRPVSIISNHLSTVLLYEDDLAIGYGHLDKDGETIWLGICIRYDKKGKGYGKMVMDKLIEDAKKNNVSAIKLSVDSGNSTAIGLYNAFGFVYSHDLKPGVALMILGLKK